MYYSVREVADRLRVSRQTVYRWVSEGKIPKPRFRSSRRGNRLFTRAELTEIFRFVNSVESLEDETERELPLFCSD